MTTSLILRTNALNIVYYSQHSDEESTELAHPVRKQQVQETRNLDNGVWWQINNEFAVMGHQVDTNEQAIVQQLPNQIPAGSTPTVQLEDAVWAELNQDFARDEEEAIVAPRPTPGNSIHIIEQPFVDYADWEMQI